MTTITNPKILIVEDEAIIAEDISASLKRLGCKVTSMASTGAEAIEMTANNRPDLILMDITLKGPMDGIETAERLRTLGRVPVVYLSGNSDQKTLDRARLTEPFGYLLKPFKERELQSTIEMALFKNVREERLRKSERWLASTLHDMGDGVITTDLGGVVTFMNPIAERLTGYAAGEALGKPAGQVLQLFHEDTQAAIEVPTAAAILRGGPVELPDRTMLRTKSGSVISIDDCTAPIRDEAGNFTGAVLVFRDITEKHLIEGQNRQSQKMEAVGNLAGGIAHDFNSVLTVILGYADLLLADSQEEASREHAAEIKRAAERAAGLTRHLLNISGKHIVEPEVFNLCDLAEGMQPVLRRSLPANVDFAIRTGSEAALILADRGQIAQVLLNLVANARDAMPQGGRLTVEVGNRNLREAWNDRSASLAPGDYVVLTVTDTGCGMDPNTLAQIFDPFFTTKEKGKGTGLGLATVYGILRRNHAEVCVESTRGAGATFRVYFSRQQQAAAPRSAPDSPTFAAGSGTVLVVDDDPSLRKVASAFLRRSGYLVLEASHGAEAIDVSARHQGPIHLLLTDVVMPRMNGAETARQIVAGRPDMRVLFMSGYAENIIEDLDKLQAGQGFIQKPFAPGALGRKVREILEAEIGRAGGAS